MSNGFLPYELNQRLLLPPDLREWLPEGHLALFVSDVVDELDLSSIVKTYLTGDGRGRAPYHPAMMVKLLVYAYCTGKPSSRKIERATHDEVAYRVLSGDQHPDHDCIAEFRKRHLPALAGLFVQVLLLCQRSGLVKLGHVAIDGTKVKANASKHKAMSYERMCDTEKKLEQEVVALLEKAQAADAAEDDQYGKGRAGDELPEELSRRESRLKKIRAAKATLEKEAQERAQKAAEEAKAKIEKRVQEEEETGEKAKGRDPKVPDVANAKPEPKAQKNFTDPDSRIMKDGGRKNFEQCYNAQAAVDSERQIIVAASVTQETNDKKQLIPMVEKIKDTTGKLPGKASADAGYFSEANVTDTKLADVDLYVPPDSQKHGVSPTDIETKEPPAKTAIETMRAKLKTQNGNAVYRMRKAIVEPVFGQIKDARGFRRFSFRGLANVTAEWDFICLTHNLLKLFRSGMHLQGA